MAKLVFKDATVIINSVTLSTRVKSATINGSTNLLDSTAMQPTGGAVERTPGLNDWSIDMEFYNDEAAGNVNATLFPLQGAAAFTVEVRPTSGARSTTNPGYTGSALLESFTPLSGNVGDMAMAPAKFVNAGSALSRATS